ncbi:malonate decarboxylase holo-ACP synthase [Mycolicibacterium stellerae]|uniref:malonate decarboxylase holo-ACP synthase n=1 Tax=Mycolicibacterium stellerae TaxID=2358193 RepID=UPI0013DE5F68|nr:malonate decarboxylase holo-ACP synthase [Mycolicibacterium stellerae]
MTRPHDLLRLSAAATALLPTDAPAWPGTALSAAPWVVVRRAAVPDGLIPVGVRGSDRSQRYPWTIGWESVRELVTPEDLAVTLPARNLPVLEMLPAVREIFRGLRWGPTGSVGFELATGLPTASATSDLDVVVRTSLCDGEVLQRLGEVHTQLARLDVRVDCQVETPKGAIALAELVSASDDVLVRTPFGPRLVERLVAAP